jgi:threonine dehydratase
MADQHRPLTPANVRAAYSLIKPYVHRTPLLTSQTLNRIASRPLSVEDDDGDKEGSATCASGEQKPAAPTFRFYFKCENYQRIGAFKPRGAFHAVLRLVAEKGEEEVRKRGVITHSSGS